MKKKFQLQIPEPCHEDWNKMTPADKGRFCGSCQKTVMDFTGMSDTQLVAFFKKPSTGSVCGRFVNDQLERDIAIPRKRIPWLKYFFQIALPAFLVSQKTVAQGEVKIKTGEIVAVLPQCNFGKEAELVCEEKPVTEKGIQIKGRVVDENGDGIPYASVHIKGTKTGTSCDSSGNFQINPGINKKSITLVSSCIGFMAVEKSVDISDRSSPEIIMKVNAALSGEVVVTSSIYVKGRFARMGAYSIGRKVSAVQKIKNFFTGDSVGVYPNPAKSGGVVNIKWGKNETGEYRFDIYNLHGQLIRSETNFIETKNQMTSFRLISVVQGVYFLRITNKKSGNQHTEKIIVQ